MEKDKLRKMFKLTATNFKFKLDEDFNIFFEMIYEKVKNIPDEMLTKRFQQLWLRTNEEWNKEYGYAGYPSFADWILILTEKRALTDKQIEQEKKKHEERLKWIVSYVYHWIDPKYDCENDCRPFARYYLEPRDEEQQKTRDLINKFYNVTTELTYDEARELGLKIRQESWEELKPKLLRVVKEQNQLLLD